MRRRYEVKAGGMIDGLRAIGFHGEVDPAQTPGRREAILADETWHLVGLEPVGLDGSEDGAQAVWGQVGSRVEPGTLPGSATPLDRPLPAQLGHIFVILGRMELGYADALATVEPHVEAPHVSALLRWLHEPESSPPANLQVQRRGEQVLWYCSVEDAFALYQRICRMAEKEMVRASNAGNERALYEASWWLARASLDDSDRYFAAAGLERSNRSIADAYLKATFRRRPAQEIEASLRHARGVLDAGCENERRRADEHSMQSRSAELKPTRLAGGPLNIGPVLLGARDRIRGRYLVPQRQAA